MARFDSGMGLAETIGGATASAALSADCMFDLGLKYSAGRGGVSVDLVAAHMWFNLAASRGHRAARTYRAEVASDLTRQQVAKAQRQAREWISGKRRFAAAA